MNLWSFGAAGLIGALCNTVLFMTTLCLCFYNTEYIQGFVAAVSRVVDIWGLHRLRIRCLETYRTPVG